MYTCNLCDEIFLQKFKNRIFNNYVYKFIFDSAVRLLSTLRSELMIDLLNWVIIIWPEQHIVLSKDGLRPHTDLFAVLDMKQTSLLGQLRIRIRFGSRFVFDGYGTGTLGSGPVFYNLNLEKILINIYFVQSNCFLFLIKLIKNVSFKLLPKHVNNLY